MKYYSESANWTKIAQEEQDPATGPRGGGFTQTKRGQGSGVGSGSEQGAEGDVMGGSS